MITRLEIIDHSSNFGQKPNGREILVSPEDNKLVSYDVQDDGRTLKVFIDDKPTRDKPSVGATDTIIPLTDQETAIIEAVVNMIVENALDEKKIADDEGNIVVTMKDDFIKKYRKALKGLKNE